MVLINQEEIIIVHTSILHLKLKGLSTTKYVDQRRRIMFQNVDYRPTVYVPVISKTLEHIETFNTNWKVVS